MSGMHRTLCFSSLGLCGSLALWHVLWRSRGCSQGERGRGPSNPGPHCPLLPEGPAGSGLSRMSSSLSLRTSERGSRPVRPCLSAEGGSTVSSFPLLSPFPRRRLKFTSEGEPIPAFRRAGIAFPPGCRQGQGRRSGAPAASCAL